jgi:adenosylcobyric acid synthase
MHGLFDHPESTQAFLKWAGLRSHASVDLNVIREEQLERLSSTIEESIRTNFIKSFVD